jgi:putative phage-type endonuclease
MAELTAELLTGLPAEKFTNAAMQWGTEQEPAARLAYEFLTNKTVVEVGLFKHPSIVGTHASPDGLIDDDGLIEIKCPNTATHIETLLSESVEGKYITQIQWQLACTGRAWCDFVSFDPRLPAEMQLFVKRIKRDDAGIAALERDVLQFINELDEQVAALRAKFLKAAA